MTQTIPNEAIEAAARAIRKDEQARIGPQFAERLATNALTAALPHLSASDDGVRAPFKIERGLDGGLYAVFPNGHTAEQWSDTFNDCEVCNFNGFENSYRLSASDDGVAVKADTVHRFAQEYEHREPDLTPTDIERMMIEDAINGFLSEHALTPANLPGTTGGVDQFPQPKRKDGGEPCGECRLQPGETCDICGAAQPPRATDEAAKGGDVALRALLLSAKMLQQNAEGCAVNHYGEDFATHGLPGWLADTAKDIANAEAALASLDQPKGSADGALREALEPFAALAERYPANSTVFVHDDVELWQC